jgi:hypothetical protein
MAIDWVNDSDHSDHTGRPSEGLQIPRSVGFIFSWKIKAFFSQGSHNWGLPACKFVEIWQRGFHPGRSWSTSFSPWKSNPSPRFLQPIELNEAWYTSWFPNIPIFMGFQSSTSLYAMHKRGSIGCIPSDVGEYPLVIKHGLLENPPLIDDIPIFSYWNLHLGGLFIAIFDFQRVFVVHDLAAIPIAHDLDLTPLFIPNTAPVIATMIIRPNATKNPHWLIHIPCLCPVIGYEDTG